MFCLRRLPWWAWGLPWGLAWLAHTHLGLLHLLHHLVWAHGRGIAHGGGKRLIAPGDRIAPAVLGP